jgi:general secretion pathway protein H
MTSQCDMSAPAWDDRQAGFSLAEMLVVLAILSLCLALAAPKLANTDAREMEWAGRELAALLREARTRAIFSGADAVVDVDLRARRVAAGWTNRAVGIPKAAGIRVLTAEEEVVKAGDAPFRFFADGSATGGKIELTRERASVVVTVDWLTGRVDRRTEK